MAKQGDLVGTGPRKLLLTLAALLVVASVRGGLVFLSYHSVRRLIPRGRNGVAPLTLCARTAHAVERVARFVPGATCLTQAFAVQWMLAARGYGSEIRIGVAQEDGEFKAHAWLVSDGHVVIGGRTESLARFKPLTSITVPDA